MQGVGQGPPPSPSPPQQMVAKEEGKIMSTCIPCPILILVQPWTCFGAVNTCVEEGGGTLCFYQESFAQGLFILILVVNN
jgi:hypothetical protein